MKYILVRENVITLKMMAHIISTNYELHFEIWIWVEYNEGFFKVVVAFLCSAVVYLGRNSTKDPALKRLCMGKFQIYGASYSSGMSNKVKQAIVQRCTCFKGLIYLELKE